jgi:hypothetical protein
MLADAAASLEVLLGDEMYQLHACTPACINEHNQPCFVVASGFGCLISHI